MEALIMKFSEEGHPDALEATTGGMAGWRVRTA